MKQIAIQSGHWNMTSGATGAPEEQRRTIAIGQRLVELLNQNGFQAVRCDAFADGDTNIINKDWDLFLALHCDANYAGDEGGGFFDWIDPSVDSTPESNAESKRIMDAMISVYFSETGIRNVETRRNPNTKLYYMWSALSLKTSCVIVEMGESIDPHDNVILNDTDRVAKALLKGIMKAFPVQTPAPVDTIDSLKQKIEDLKQTEIRLQREKDVLQTEMTNKLAEKDRVCLQKLQDYKTKVVNLTKTFNEQITNI